jgi:hypothetical protein
MRPVKLRPVIWSLLIWSLLVSTFGLHPHIALASTPVTFIPSGTSLATALKQLRSRDFTILFSDRLVTTELRVAQNSVIDNPRDTALRLLANHGLTLRNVRPGLFVVTRLPALDPAKPTDSPYDLEPLAEIAIYASRYSSESPLTTTAQLDRADIENLAGLNEDALRVTRTLPGTASTPLSSKTHVRGGSDDEMLVRFDGIPQLAPFHFKDYGAILGSIEPATIDTLDFFSGVFPVRHGDRLSAVMDIQPRRTDNGNHHEIGLSLLAAHAMSVGKTQINDSPSRWLVAGRSSSAGWVARAVDIDNIEIEFSDLLVRGEHIVDDWTLVAGLSILQDELDYQNDDSRKDRERSTAGYRDNTLWLKATRDTTTDHRLALAFAKFDSHADRRGEWSGERISIGRVAEDRKTDGYYFDLAWQRPGSWSIGAEILNLNTRYDHSIRANFDSSLSTAFNRAPNLERRILVDAETRSVSAYASKLITLSSAWRLDFGIRADQRNQPSNAIDWSPRLAMEYELADGRFLRVSAGRTSQGQRADELQVADGETSFRPVQKADQWVLGYEQLLADHGAWRVEAYRKRIHDPAPRYENLLNPVSLIPEMEIDRRRIAPDGALAYGVEFAGRYTLDESWSGFLNYAWSEVEDDIGTSDVPRNWNQQHALLLGLLWRSGPWSLSGQGSWRTGWSRTEFQIGDSGALLPVVGERNRARWPAQWNLDIRASWRKPLKIGLLEIALDVNNATNRSNPCCTDLRMAPTGLETRTQSWLPRYLNVGVVWNLP